MTPTPPPLWRAVLHAGRGDTLSGADFLVLLYCVEMAETAPRFVVQSWHVAGVVSLCSVQVGRSLARLVRRGYLARVAYRTYALTLPDAGNSSEMVSSLARTA